MAIFHFSVKIIGRNEGRSAVAAAAYRSGECLTNEYDGLVHDYTRKHWVEHTEIFLPENAPDEYNDRETLWNAVEGCEKSSNAQLAREFELALPIEMTREQQIELVRSFCKDVLVADGMIADACIHNPPVTNDRHEPLNSEGNPTNDIDKMQFKNPHVHILTTLRTIDTEGKWEKKTRVQYVCKHCDEEQVFTAEEYRQAKNEGWEKQYRYEDSNGVIEFHTQSEAYERDLKRINSIPKTTPYGLKNETVARWNSKEQVKVWRKAWEDCINDAFEKIDSDIRVDSRSFVEQGRYDELPTLHMGKSANYMEKKALRELREGKPESEIIHSDIGMINEEIREHNRLVRELRDIFDDAIEKAREWIIELAKILEAKRAMIISNLYNASILKKDFDMLGKDISSMANIKRYDEARSKVFKANADSRLAIKNLQEQIKESKPHQVKTNRQLQQQIKEEQESIEQRRDYLDNVKTQCGITSEADFMFYKRELKQKEKMITLLEKNLNTINNKINGIKKEYKTEYNKIDKFDIPELNTARRRLRPDFEDIISTKIKESDNFNEYEFNRAKEKTNDMLDDKILIKTKTLKKKKHMHH